jgi:hypothetical protein
MAPRAEPGAGSQAASEAASWRVLWAPVPPDTPVGRLAGADRPIQLPYLVDGPGLQMLAAGKGVPLDDYDLLRGILAAYFEDPQGASEVGTFRPYQQRAIAALAQAFRRPSVERMVLETAPAMAMAHGWALGREALRTGIALVPASAQLLCDYLTAGWRLLEAGSPCDRTAVLGELVAEGPRVDLARVRPLAAQYLLVVRLGAATALGRLEERAALLATARELLTDGYLKGKLEELLAAESPFDIGAFGLFQARSREWPVLDGTLRNREGDALDA